MATSKQEKQVVTKQRVYDHGEVYTAQREVSGMLDLVKEESERIESKIFEPACGTGNFLLEVLKRKLQVIESQYKKSQIEFERYSVVTVASIYGIDILEDNVAECRKRLLELFEETYRRLFAKSANQECEKAIRYILDRNIIRGDALTLKTVGDDIRPIVFSEWAPVNGSMIKRRDFSFQTLISQSEMVELPLFSDLGEKALIPTPIKDFPLVHFLRLSDVE